MDKDKVIRALKSREFDVHWFETGKEAVEYLAGEFKGHKIAFGGSMTTKQLGLYDKLAENNEVFWHWVTNDPAKKRQAEIESDVYIASANGITEDGQIVNVDGSCNRVTNLAYGHEHVVYVVGVNKIVPTLEDAMWRAKNIAAPLNSRKGNSDTPCVHADEMKCYDCMIPTRNCRVMTITMYRPKLIKDAKVIIINEELGF